MAFVNRPVKIKPKKQHNIIQHLRYRELVDFNSQTSHYFINRRLYQNICPNFSVINIDKPPCFLKKFTPDGKYLIAFSNDQTFLIIFSYQGPFAADEFLNKITTDYSFNGEKIDSESVRNNLFLLFFKLKCGISLTTSERLNRECCLFTNDSKYTIVASSVKISPQLQPSYNDIVRNNENLGINVRSCLEDVSIHLVDIVKGRKCDQLVFRTDFIVLSHSQGLYLLNDTLAILSIYHQTIHLYKIVDCDEMGKRFRFINSIGRLCFPDDDRLIAPPMEDPDPEPDPPALMNLINPQLNPEEPTSEDVLIGSLKHRFMAFLYFEALAESQETGKKKPLIDYYFKFDDYFSLRMSKIQLFDEDHLLIKYEVSECITSGSLALDPRPCYFCTYQISTATILQIYESCTNEFVQILENYCDYFRNTRTYTCSTSNCMYTRESAKRFKRLLKREHDERETSHRLLSLIPYTSQSFTPTPYLDLSLFSYDDRWITPLERPKSCGVNPIGFLIQNKGPYRFRIHTDRTPNASPGFPMRLIAFTFHPFEPFAFSQQRVDNHFALNFHFRHKRC